MMISRAAKNCAQPGTVILPYFLSNHPLSGHAANPENNANQPLVGGHGPKVIISPAPPTIVTKLHAQPAAKPTTRRSRRPRSLQLVDAILSDTMNVLSGLDSTTGVSHAQVIRVVVARVLTCRPARLATAASTTVAAVVGSGCSPVDACRISACLRFASATSIRHAALDLRLRSKHGVGHRVC